MICEDCLTEIFSLLTVLLKRSEDNGEMLQNAPTLIANNVRKVEHRFNQSKIKIWVDNLSLPEDIPYCHGTKNTTEFYWNFVCLLLTAFDQLVQYIQVTKEVLLTVNQKKVLQDALQFVSALGVLPFLVPSIEISVQMRLRSSFKCYEDLLQQCEKDVMKDRQKLGVVVCQLVKYTEQKTSAVCGIILTTALNDLVPALIQLSWKPFDYDDSMSKEDYEKNLQQFRLITEKFVRSVHQPTIIRELLLHMNPNATGHRKKPGWFLKACSRLLTKCLLNPLGVISTVRALHDLGDATEDRSKQYLVTAKLLYGPHGPNAQQYYQHLCGDLLQLLKSDNPEYQQVVVNTMNLIYKPQKELCQQLVLDPLCQPLITDFAELTGNVILEKSIEEELSVTVARLLLITCPEGIPVDALVSYMSRLCNLYLATRFKGGTPQLRQDVQDLISNIVSHTEDSDIWSTFLELPEDCLLNFAAKSSSVAMVIFKNLLENLNKSKDLDVRLMYCKQLIGITELPSVQKFCLQRPNSDLISTLQTVLQEQDSELTPIVLLLLGTMISECEDWSPYQSLIPVLQSLRHSILLTESLRAVTEEILATIATLGAGTGGRDILRKQASHILESASSTSEPRLATQKEGLPCSTFEQTLVGTALGDALSEIRDVEIPVKGHGYIMLTRLIKGKDGNLTGALDKIFSVCISGLVHDDSYIYLAAVGTLSALTLKSLSKFLPRLTEIYCNPKTEVTLKTRLGESLLQVSKELGEVASNYQNLLMNAFLVTTKDASPAVRTSSLSNLGEICRVLGFQVSKQLQEILTCAHAIATTDPEMEVRRAAVMLIVLLLRGLGPKAVLVLGSSALEVYRDLKKLAQNDDEIVCLQAQLALDELRYGIEDGFSTPQSLEKNIFITSPPP